MDSIREFNTPCFIIDEAKLKNNIVSFENALNNVFNRGVVGYSIKTNSLPFLLEKVMEYGCYAEVVSADEYLLARKIGFPIHHIIYNGPMKNKETFIEAVEGGAVVNIENFREIDWLKEVNPKCNYNLGLRININFSLLGLDEEFHSYSRFGFSYENGDIEKAIKVIGNYGFRVNGIHAHRTSLSRELLVYKKIMHYISKIIADMKLELSYIDVGGGFFGDMPGKPSYYDYAIEIKHNLQIDTDNLIVIVEPGNGLIASPVDYVFSIIDTKEIQGKIVCSSDGTRLDVDPLFHKESYNYELLIDDLDMRKEKCQIITGSTCLENDILMELHESKKLKPGDKIVLKCVGAYTMSLTPNFINYLPTAYAKNDYIYRVVRNKWNAEIIMMNSNMEEHYE